MVNESSLSTTARSMTPTERPMTLCIHGGTAAISDQINAWPPNDPAVKNALDALFESGQWGNYTGDVSEQLKLKLAAYFVRDHVFLCSSGTIGIELALRAAKIKPGDEVILAAYDFPGNFRSIEAVGATPVLVDLAADRWQIDVSQITHAISANSKAIIATHLHGELLLMPAIQRIAQQYELTLIEDICQCPGAMLPFESGTQAPSETRQTLSKAGQWGDLSVLSFGGSKLLSAGRGGAVLTDQQDMFQRMLIFADRGNHAFPLSQLQAAVLVPQLEVLDKRNEYRLNNARRIIEHIGQFDWLTTLDLNGKTNGLPAFYKLPLLLTSPGSRPWDRSRIVATLQAEGVPIDIGFQGFAKRSARRCRKIGSCPNAQYVADNTIVLHHPVLLESDSMIDQLLYAFDKLNHEITRS